MHMLVNYITVRGILKFTDTFFNWIYWYFRFWFCVNTVNFIGFYVFYRHILSKIEWSDPNFITFLYINLKNPNSSTFSSNTPITLLILSFWQRCCWYVSSFCYFFLIKKQLKLAAHHKQRTSQPTNQAVHNAHIYTLIHLFTLADTLTPTHTHTCARN